MDNNKIVFVHYDLTMDRRVLAIAADGEPSPNSRQGEIVVFIAVEIADNKLGTSGSGTDITLSCM